MKYNYEIYCTKKERKIIADAFQKFQEKCLYLPQNEAVTLIENIANLTNSYPNFHFIKWKIEFCKLLLHLVFNNLSTIYNEKNR